MKLSLGWCAEQAGGVLAADASREVHGVSTDTRALPPGCLFAALSGPNHDGHDFVELAIAGGAAAALVSRKPHGAVPHILVPDVLAALQQLARAARRLWGSSRERSLVGVTGSAGKTTAKDAIASVLSTLALTGKTAGNFNNHIGVPLSILNLPDEARFAVLEIGMNHAGEIGDLCRIAQPGIGVVTNVGTAHLENFDSIEGVAAAKRELIESLPPDGIAVLNADDERVNAFRAIHPGRTVTFGTVPGAEVRATGVRYTGTGASHFHVEGMGDFDCPLPARGGLMAALAALAVAKALKIPPEPLAGAIARLQPAKMRLERAERGGMVIWNDCYNSNPEAAKMMVELLAETPAERRIAVLGEMLELGRWSEELHRDVGLHVVRCGITVLVGIRGAACHLVDAARGAGLTAGAAYFFQEPSEAGVFLKSFARRGDALLFKGSRSTRVELALEEFLR